MEDLIRRSDAIDAVCEIVPIREDAIEIADAIRAIPSADRPQGEWIDCKERMPMESSFEPLLICDSNGHMTVGAMILGKWAKQANIGAVVAWMPIEPWKGADDD